MKPTRKIKRAEDQLLEDEDDGVPVSLSALARLTNSEMIRQVKAGLDHLDPLEKEDSFEEEPY